MATILVVFCLPLKYKRIFSLERGNKGKFASKQKNTKMAAILEWGVFEHDFVFR